MSDCVEQTCELQRVLFGLGRGTHAECLGWLLSTYVLDAADVKLVTETVMQVVRCRPEMAVVCRDFMKDVTSEDNRKTVSAVLLDNCYDNGLFFQHAYRVYFARLCMVEDVISIENVIEECRKLMMVKDRYDRFVSLVFMWFAPELQSSDNELYTAMLSHCRSVWEYDFFAVIMYDVVENMARYAENDWAQWKMFREVNYWHDPVLRTIASDNVDELSRMTADNSIDINGTLKPFTFHWRPLTDACPTMVQCAALLGAVNCFRFLVLSGANLKKEDFKMHNLAMMAVAGGNSEIVRLVEEKQKASFGEALHVAAMYHQNELFDWLIENEMSKLAMSDGVSYVIHAAIEANNCYAFMRCMECGFNVLKSLDDNVFSLFTKFLFVFRNSTSHCCAL